MTTNTITRPKQIPELPEPSRRQAVVRIYVNGMYQGRAVTHYIGTRQSGELERFTYTAECEGVPNGFKVWIEGFGNYEGRVLNPKLQYGRYPEIGDQINLELIMENLESMRVAT